jgi:hypothetical protein
LSVSLDNMHPPSDAVLTLGRGAEHRLRSLGQRVSTQAYIARDALSTHVQSRVTALEWRPLGKP